MVGRSAAAAAPARRAMRILQDDFAEGTTVSVKVWAVKVAATERAALMVTEQEAPVPVHAPVQPLKVEPAAGVAVNVTAVPLA